MEHDGETNTTICSAPTPSVWSFFVVVYVSTVPAYPTKEVAPHAKFLLNQRGLKRREHSASAISMFFLALPSGRGGRRYSHYVVL